MKDLWVEKYRPKKIEEYVFKDNAQKRQVETGQQINLFYIYYLG